MKILVVSDIHSNWPALKAVHNQQPDFDACLVLGDLVEYGPFPREVIQWVREHATYVIRGNHDHAIAQFVQPRRDDSPSRRLRNRIRDYHWQSLSRDELSYLAKLAVRLKFTLDGRVFELLHASPRDPLNEYMHGGNGAWSECARRIEADFLCVGHTHRQVHVSLGRLSVLNPGSVGQPRDRISSASYATIEDGEIAFHRVEYSFDEMLEGYQQVGLDSEQCETALSILQNGSLG